MGVKETIKEMEEKTGSALASKPIWIFWLVYTGITAVLFGIFYAVSTMLVARWWIPVIVILIIGVIWGSFGFTRSSRREEAGK